MTRLLARLRAYLAGFTRVKQLSPAEAAARTYLVSRQDQIQEFEFVYFPSHSFTVVLPEDKPPERRSESIYPAVPSDN